jgi:PilZ domain
VLIGKISSFEARNQHLRSSLRLNSRVPVALEWMENGQMHQAAGYTVDVSPKGCMAIVPQGFAMGQKLRLVNQVTGLVTDAILIWRGHEGRTGWELGLELKDPPVEFWGVEF